MSQPPQGSQRTKREKIEKEKYCGLTPPTITL